MKKSVVIIGSILVVGAIAAAVTFFIHTSPSQKAETPHIAVRPPEQKPDPASTEQLELTFQPPGPNATAPSASAANQTGTDGVSTAKEEDSHVTLGFFDDLVALALANYQPAHSVANPSPRSRLDLSVKTLNMHYGLSLEGLNDGREDMPSARQAILSYILTPNMLDFLFDLYGHECILKAQEKASTTVKRFPGDSGEAESRLMTLEQQKDFFRLTAQKLQDLGKIFKAIGTMDQFSAKVEKYLKLRIELNNAYYTFWGLNDSNAEQAEIDRAASAIKSNILAFDQSKKALVASIVNTAHPEMTGEGDILYIAKWAFRRETDQSTSPKTFEALGTNLITLGDDFSRHGNELD